MSFVVAVCPTRLPDHTQIMHGEKRKVETYEHQGEDEFSDFLTQSFPVIFGIQNKSLQISRIGLRQ